MSRNGKIARLPLHLREQINRRIQDGENGREIIAWLNSLDEVKAVLSQPFENPEITDGNLSEWKLGGYRDWEARQFALAESRRVMEEGQELGEAGQGALADHLGTWIVGQYIMATRKMREKMENGDDAGAWKLLRELCHDLVALRRGDHGAEWLRLEHERLKLQQQKQESSRETLKEEIRKENPPREALSEEEQERRWCQIFGIDPETHPMHQKRNPFAREPESAEPVAPPSDLSAPSDPSDAATEDPPQDPEARELQRVMESANAGHPYSEYCLGARYRDGFGVPKDLEKAREWLEKAASHGIGGARIELNALLRRWDPEARQAFDQPN